MKFIKGEVFDEQIERIDFHRKHIKSLIYFLTLRKNNTN